MRVRIRVRDCAAAGGEGGYISQSELRWRRVWDLWGVLVEMCTEIPQSQRSIKIQNMLTEMLHPPASIVVRTRSLDLVRQLCGVPGHCLLEHPPD